MTSKLWKCAAITGHGPEEYDSERGAVYCLVRLLIANRLAHGRYYCQPGKHHEASKYKSKQSHVTYATGKYHILSYSQPPHLKVAPLLTHSHIFCKALRIPRCRQINARQRRTVDNLRLLRTRS